MLDDAQNAIEELRLVLADDGIEVGLGGLRPLAATRLFCFGIERPRRPRKQGCAGERGSALDESTAGKIV